jgi:hypothetical protein
MADVPAKGTVPPVVVPAVVTHPDIHAVLAICGFSNVMDRTSIINNEGFQLIADFGVLEDKDVFEMVNRLGNCTVAAGRVNIGAIQVQKLQALCYWVRDQQKHGQGITQDDWDDNTVMATIEKMHIERDETLAMFRLWTWASSIPMISKPMKLHLLTCWHKRTGRKAKILSISCMMSLFLLSLSMMPKGTCISYPLQARLTAWTISRFTIC